MNQKLHVNKTNFHNWLLLSICFEAGEMQLRSYPPIDDLRYPRGLNSMNTTENASLLRDQSFTNKAFGTISIYICVVESCGVV